MTPRPPWDAGLVVLGAFLFGSGMLVGQLGHDYWLSRIDESTRLGLQAMAASTQTALEQVAQALKDLPTCAPPAPPSKHRLWWQRP